MKSPFERFPEYRKFQDDVIESVHTSERKVTFIDGPPGTGKSLIGMSLCSLKEKSLYVCTTKPLQEQLRNDFPETPMLMGRANYPCAYSDRTMDNFPLVSCEDCTGEKSCMQRCVYVQQKKLCQSSPSAILNLSYYLTEVNFVGSFSDYDLVVIDECDKTEEAVQGFISVNLNHSLIEKYIQNMPRHQTFLGWRTWASENHDPVLKRYLEFKSWVKPDSNQQARKDLKHLGAFVNKLNILANNLDDSWIFQVEAGKFGVTYQFKPVWISGLAHTFLWDSAKRFVLMSGSIFPTRQQHIEPVTMADPSMGISLSMADSLGLNDNEWDYIEVPNQFPADRRPVYYSPTANLSAKTIDAEQSRLIPRVQEILDKYPNDKGLIHTVSYKLTQYIVNNVNSPRLHTHGSGITARQDLLDTFRASSDPMVMVSPSMDRGIDLPHDLCRFVVIMKIPYPNLGDKQISRKLHSSDRGQRWYRWITLCSIVQMSMRGMRAADDQCDIYILDSKFDSFYAKNITSFPEWWKEALHFEKPKIYATDAQKFNVDWGD